jgi:hypothetical protein
LNLQGPGGPERSLIEEITLSEPRLEFMIRRIPAEGFLKGFPSVSQQRTVIIGKGQLFLFGQGPPPGSRSFPWFRKRANVLLSRVLPPCLSIGGKAGRNKGFKGPVSPGYEKKRRSSVFIGSLTKSAA